MGGSYLFDASSIIGSLKFKKLENLVGNCTQWLAIYESINALWKEVRLKVGGSQRLTAEEALKLAEVLSEVLKRMEVLTPMGLEREVLRVAIETGLTAYDSSYLVLARARDLTLVTEDEFLRRVASRYVRALSLFDLP